MSVAEQAPQAGPAHEEYIGRHRAPEPYVGRHRAPELHVVVDVEDTPAESVDVTVSDTPAKVEGMGLVDAFHDAASQQETADSRVERGKEAARLVGNSVIAATQTAGTKLSETFTTVSEAGKKGISSFRNFLKARSESARARKDAIASAVKGRTQKVTGSAGRGYETSKNGVTRAGRVGKEALKFSGLAVLGTGAIATEVAAKGVRYGVDKVARGTEKTMDYGRTKVVAGKEYALETVGLMHENVVDLRAGNQKYRANKAGKKAHKAMLKEAHRMNRHFDTEQRLKAMRGESE